MLNVRRAVTVLFSLKMEAVDLSLLQWSAEMTRGCFLKVFPARSSQQHARATGFLLGRGSRPLRLDYPFVAGWTHLHRGVMTS
jgi:hypothetical protein